MHHVNRVYDHNSDAISVEAQGPAVLVTTDSRSLEQEVPSVEFKRSSSSDDDSYYSLQRLRERRRGERDEDSGLSRRVKRFYKTQDELIDVYERVHNHGSGNEAANQSFEQKLEDDQKMASILTKVSLVANIVSFSDDFFLVEIDMIASLDPVHIENHRRCLLPITFGYFLGDRFGGRLDVLGHSLLGMARDQETRQVPLPARYATASPITSDRTFFRLGRTRLEPVAIVILSVIMCAASVLVVYESLNTIVNYAQFFTEKNTTKTLSEIDMSAFPIATIVVTIIVKAILFFLCFRIKTPTMSALAADHRNDVFSNLVALVCGLIGKRQGGRRKPI